MELKQIKNPNAMTATEMAMILAGDTFCTGASGAGKDAKTGLSYSADSSYSVYDKNGVKISGGSTQVPSTMKDDVAEAKKDIQEYIKLNTDLGRGYTGTCP